MPQRRRRKPDGAAPARSGPTPEPGDLTLQQLKQRAAVAGIEIDDERWDLAVYTVNAALRPLRAFSSSHRELEPAVRFQA